MKNISPRPLWICTSRCQPCLLVPAVDVKGVMVVGVVLLKGRDPPQNAVVLCVDEKSQIQALYRTQPILPFRPGLPERATTTTNATTRPRCSPRWRSRLAP